MKKLYTMLWPQPAMIDALRAEIEEFEQNFHDDPRFLSAWGHEYFCAQDGAPLLFNFAQPHLHKCSICGKEYTGFIPDGCHVTMVRNLAAVTAIQCAMLYTVDNEKKYLALLQKIIGFYADNYARFAPHAKEKITMDLTADVGGVGKIMPQGLNESILLIRMLTAMEIVKEHLNTDFIAKAEQLLFTPAIEMLRPQKMHIHNIPCWINSMIGMAGLFFNRQAWIDEALTLPFNIHEQVAQGVTQAGFWYEGSIHYNFFALEGIMNLLVFCKQYRQEMPAATLDKIQGMLFAAYGYAFDNFSFPNPSDGWPNIGLKTYSYVYYMGAAVFGEPILALLQEIENSPLPRQRLPLSEPYYYQNHIPLERILYAPQTNIETMPLREKAPQRTSCNFESYNSAILRNPYFNVFFKYGHQTKSHAHPDKMNIEVLVQGQPFTRDLSNSGYSSRLCNEWHRRNAAHSTCIVNGIESNIDSPGRLLAYTPLSVQATAQAQPGVQFTRKLVLDGTTLLDNFFVECAQQSSIDWLYHFEQPIDLSAYEQKDAPLTDYPYLLSCVRLAAEGRLAFSAHIAQVEIILPQGTEVYAAQSPANPANHMRTTLLLRQQANTAQFCMKTQVLA